MTVIWKVELPTCDNVGGKEKAGKIDDTQVSDLVNCGELLYQ